MTETTWLFLVCHIYAFIWSFTHIVILTGIVLIWLKRWMLLVAYATLLSMANQVTLPKMESVIRFFIPALEKLFGGCEIIRNDVSARDRHKHERNRPVLYAVHPHAIVANGFGLAMADCVRRGERVTVAGSSWLWFFNPLFKWFLNVMGLDFTTVRRADMSAVMSRGVHVAIIPGGFDELLLMESGKDVVFIRKRMGFLRYAMRYGYEVVPVFLFGESRLYTNLLSPPEWVRKYAAKLRVPLVIPKGRTWCSLLPNKPIHGLRVVFGEPLQASHFADLHQLHRSYISTIQVMFDTYNPYPNTPLVVK